MVVIDLFCGLGGFSRAFRDRGHRVIGLDIVPPADILADVRSLPFNGELKTDVVLASPPCTEFSKYGMRGMRKGRHGKDWDIKKGLELVRAAIDAIESLSPRWWVLENVRDSREFITPLVGSAPEKFGSRWLWGKYPFILCDRSKMHGKWRLPPSRDRPRLRSVIPYGISLRLCEAMERMTKLNEQRPREMGVETKEEADFSFDKKRTLLRRIYCKGTPSMLRKYLDKMTAGDVAEKCRLLESVPLGERLRLMVHPENTDNILDRTEKARAPIETGGEMFRRLGWKAPAGE